MRALALSVCLLALGSLPANAKPQQDSRRGQPNGYASLDGDGKVPAAQLPASQGGAAWGDITGTLADQSDLQASLDAKSATSHNHAGTYEPAGVAFSELSGTASDAQVPAAIARDTEVTSAVSTHEGAGDPHTGYQRESEKAQANGYASLGADGKVPSAQLPAGGGGGPTYVRVATSDYTNATTNPTNITGLALSVTAGTVYSFGCELFSASSAATVGVRPGFTFPAVNHFRATCQIPASASALAWFNVTATGQSCDATASQGTGVAQIFISGTIEPSASGTLQVQGEAETTGTITIHRGSKCWLQSH